MNKRLLPFWTQQLTCKYSRLITRNVIHHEKNKDATVNSSTSTNSIHPTPPYQWRVATCKGKNKEICHKDFNQKLEVTLNHFKHTKWQLPRTDHNRVRGGREGGKVSIVYTPKQNEITRGGKTLHCTTRNFYSYVNFATVTWTVALKFIDNGHGPHYSEGMFGDLIPNLSHIRLKSSRSVHVDNKNSSLI